MKASEQSKDAEVNGADVVQAGVQSSAAAHPAVELPAWLAQTEAYQPTRDRDAFLRRNVLNLTAMLEAFRAPQAATPASPVDRACAHVAPTLRLLGLLLVVALVSAAYNLAFCWLLLAIVLCTAALRPAQQIAALLKPALAVTALAALVNLPAALMLGQPQAPVRIAIKTFLTVSLATNTAQALGLTGTIAALRGLHLPTQFIFTAELAIRDLGLLGEAAQSLSEALELRSIGTNASKTASTAGVLGATFLRAQRLAAGQAEAMLLRGYTGELPAGEASHRFTFYDAAYLLFVAALLAAFIYFESAVGI